MCLATAAVDVAVDAAVAVEALLAVMSLFAVLHWSSGEEDPKRGQRR